MRRRSASPASTIRAREARLLQLRADLRGQPLVFQRHAGDGGHGAHAAGILELDRRIVDEGRQQVAVALQARDAPSLIEAWNLDRSPVRIHVATAGRRGERQREGWIAQGASQGVAPAQRDPTTELHRQIGDATASEARREQSARKPAGMAAWMKASGEVLDHDAHALPSDLVDGHHEAARRQSELEWRDHGHGQEGTAQGHWPGANAARCRRSRRWPARCPANPGPGLGGTPVSRSTRRRRG